MNIDHIHDALNLLDDDLIEEVEKLRSNKTAIVKMGRRNTWIRWVSVAACVCILAFTVYMTDGFGRVLHKSSGSKNMAKEESNEVAGVEEDTDGQNGASGMNGGSSKESKSAFVKIVSWGKDGFTGTIIGDDNIVSSNVGTTVIVKFAEDVSADFPAGSEVLVQYYEQENVTNAGSNAESQPNNGEIVLYAETITLKNTD